MSPGKPSIVAVNCLIETMWARRCRPGRYPIRAFSYGVSRATCRPGNLSLATCHPGFPGIVDGENGKDIDVYLRPLIDNLKDLWAKPGGETIDVATGLKFNMRAMVLWTINDFPARSSFFGWSVQGYKACPTCNEVTPSVRVDPPREFSRDAIMTQLARLPTRVKGKHPRFEGVKIKRNVLIKLNWTKRSIFYELKYWSFLTLKHNLDVMHIEKNVLESILNTLLINDKSKDTTKARQELKRLGIRSGLWLDQNKNKKCSKPQAAYSFTPEDRKKFCQFIKGVKLPDGFGSNFKHKVTDNDTNITELMSHDSQSKVIDNLCNLELIYPPAFFDIMIHLIIHLPLEAIFAKPEGSIAKGYVAEEALTFSFYYFRDVTMKFNRPDCNVDCPPSMCQLQVFISLCKLIGLWSVIRIDLQELKKVIWYVLHNSPEIDMYRAKFKIEFPNKDMKGEFPGWFGKQIYQRHVDNDPVLTKAVSYSLWLVDHQRLQYQSTLALSTVRPPGWKVVEHVSHKKFSNGGVIVVEDNPDVIHVDNSSDLVLSTSLNDLEITALHLDGQSIDVDAPPDIIDVVDKDNDIINEEDPIPHNLADSDDEELVNLDIDDGVNVVYSSKGTRKPNLGGRRVGRLHTHQKTRNLGLKAITDKSGPVLIWFEVDDRETLMPLGDHAAHWANYLGELVRELPLHYPSWCQMPPKRKAGSWQILGPSLTCVFTWNPTAGHKSMWASSST
nr:hypothetical protein [Tanacetum cinerariifolium]